MAVSHHPHHHHTVIAFSFLLFAYATSAITLSQFGSGFQEGEANKKGSGSMVLDRFLSQRQLAVLGSSPPSCISKCGDCTPCTLVPVLIDPGSSTY